MGRWFGRKSAVPDARPYVPAWLSNGSAEEGFARFLTFEVLADSAAPAIGAMLNDASGGAISCADERTVIGYAAYGRSIGSAVEPLVSTFGIDLFDDGSTLRDAVVTTPAMVDDDVLGNGADNEPSARFRREQTAARDVPAALRIGYYDPARDYQSGEARAVASEDAGNEEQRELAAVIDAATAKGLAQTVLARAWARRDSLTLRLPPSWIGLEPGRELDLDLTPRRWTVTKCTIDGLVVVAELRPTITNAPTIAADAGRSLATTDIVEGEVTMALIESSMVVDAPTAEPTVLLAASSPSAGWRAKAVEVRYGGQRIADETARRKAVLGRTDTALGAEAASTVDVTLIDIDQWLVSCDADALAEGANLAMIGEELIQFTTADPIGAGQFRLSGLVRELRGTTGVVHVAGECFLLIERDALKPIALPPWASGYDVSVVCGDVNAEVRLAAKPVPAAIADPSGGATADSEARSAIAQMLTALREQGLIAS